jgi:predicted ABC-type ATPase
MEISNPKSWARKNKRAFANKMVTASNALPHDEPAAFFMAGLPGAGKTEFTINLIQDLSLKVVRIDMDEIATHIDAYDPLHADAFREAATDVLNSVFDRATHRKVDFIMDGTFRSDSAIRNIERALQKDYTIRIFYIYQDPAIAWTFTQAREKIEKRAINRQGFINAYYEIHENIRQLFHKAYEQITVDLVIKNEANGVDEWHRNVSMQDIDHLVNTRYTKEELERRVQP